jgi:phosphotransferase system enzyme I (PtsI)
VLRLLKTIVDAGHEKKIWVGICGEMSGDPIFTPVLVGLGMDEISTSPVMVPEIKRIIRSIRYDEAREIANYVLTLKSGADVANFLKHKYQQIQRQTRKAETR